MPSSPVHAASPHLPDKPPVNASAEDPPALAAEPANMPMVVDDPLPSPVVDVHPETQPDGDSSIAVPVPGIGPKTLAVPAPDFVDDDVAIGESTSLERTSPVKRVATPPCSGEAVRSTGVDRSDNQPNEKAKQKILDSLREQHQMVASLELEPEAQQVEGSDHDQVEKNDDITHDECKPKSFESRLTESKEVHEERKLVIKMKQAIDDDIGRIGRINLVETNEAVNATVDLNDSSALPVQSAGVDRSDAQAGLSSAELFSRVDREDDPGEL